MFQKTVIDKYLRTQNSTEIAEKWKQFKSHFHNPLVQENIRGSKEEQYQEGFFRDLFVSVLGYTLNPAPDFNLTTELRNVKDAKKADGGIVISGNVVGVIELKGMDTTDLGKVEQQAFNYKNNQTGCTYVIISNFQKLRLYVDDSVNFTEFNLFELTEEQFAVFYLLLSYNSVQQDIPQKIKGESLSQEDIITKKLYKDYSVFKRELFQNLIDLNPQFDQLELFRKTQKLLDRLLFLYFGEDRGLLPPNSVRMILEDWNKLNDLDESVPLYNRFKKYFGYLNTGFKGKNHDVFAYNGGLFKPDEILDKIKINDQLLYKHSLTLSEYDFASEVDVNILGHIFENSLNEIDEVKAQLEGKEIDKSKTKRKKDGVFYTPKYITKYIVENTVGKLCEEKKGELGILEEEYFIDKKRQQRTLKSLLNKLDDYRAWLLQITIVDPACGSGAFLNEALNFLIEEHQYIDELEAKLRNVPIIFSYHSESILEHNLFGVDLNEESVEIAKLSLWLRTAEPNRKLNSLNNNIKCGNSLIDDPEVAGEKAFNWQQEFPQVFAKGGFDVVLGNPPYVKLEQIRESSKALEKMNFTTFEKRGDLYVLFVEKGFKILKDDGVISYIMPNKWMQASYGKSLRKFFLQYQINQLVDFGDIQIFSGAITYPCIFIAEKRQTTEIINISVLKTAFQGDFKRNIEENNQKFQKSSFTEDTWVISSNSDKELLEKLERNFRTLKDAIGGEAFRGVLTGLSEAFFIDADTTAKIKEKNSVSENVIVPFVQGRDIKRYSTVTHETSLILLEKGFSTKNRITDEVSGELYLQENYFGIYEWLLPFKDKAKKRSDKGDYWWELRACDYYAAFTGPKIMYQAFQVKACFIYDEQGLFCNNSMWIIPTDDKGLLAILNSKMGWWLISKYCTQIQNGYQLIWNYFGRIPMPQTTVDLSEKADLMMDYSKSLQDLSTKFQNSLRRRFGNINVTKKLQDWHNLSCADFIKELSKQKIKLSLSDEAEWADYFEQEKSKAVKIQRQINSTDEEINQMVYQLYGLTEDEIAIVENS